MRALYFGQIPTHYYSNLKGRRYTFLSLKFVNIIPLFEEGKG